MKATFSAVPLLLSSSFLYTIATAQEDVASDSLPTLILPAPEVTPTPDPAQASTPASPSASSTSRPPVPVPQIPHIESLASPGFSTPSLSISTISPEADPTSLLTDPATTPAPVAGPVTTILTIAGGDALTLVAIPTTTIDSSGDSIPSMNYLLNDVPIEPGAPLLVNDQEVHLNLPEAATPISSAGVLYVPPTDPESRENAEANIVIGSATYAVPAAAAAQETELAIDTNPPSMPAAQMTNWLAVPSGLSTSVRVTGTETGGLVLQSTVNGGAVGGLGERLSLAGVGMGLLGVGMVSWM